MRIFTNFLNNCNKFLQVLFVYQVMFFVKIKWAAKVVGVQNSYFWNWLQVYQGRKWWVGRMGSSPPSFWQNGRRRRAAAARHITTCPPSFRQPLTPLYTMSILFYSFFFSTQQCADQSCRIVLKKKSSLKCKNIQRFLCATRVQTSD